MQTEDKQQGKQYTRQHCLLYGPPSHQPYIRESGAFAERAYMGGQNHFLGCSREITYSESTTYWYSTYVHNAAMENTMRRYTPANDDSARAYCCFVDLIVEFGNN